MYSSNASHSCEVQNYFLEELNDWGNLSSYPPLIIWLQECDANPSCPTHTPSPLSRLSELPRGITMGKTGQQTVHLLLQKSDFVLLF